MAPAPASPLPAAPPPGRLPTPGFGTVELIATVLVLGMLAAVATPRARHTADLDQTAIALVSRLAVLRNAVDAYTVQHGALPGVDVTQQLSGTTNAAGHPGSGNAYQLGPYLRTGLPPANPLTSRHDIRVVDNLPAVPAGRAAWLYCHRSGEVRANVPGCAPDGTPWYEL